MSMICSQETNKKLSVCIATYNGEKYINEQLESIMCQLSNYDEVIISDDGSTDLTLKIIKNVNDDRIKVIKNTQYHGIIHNIENALSQASGDIIFLSDQDDVWLNDKVSKMCKLLETYDLVVSDCKVTDAHLNIVNESLFGSSISGAGLLKNTLRNSYVGCCMAFNRKVLNSVLPFPTNIPMHDWWIGLIAELVAEVSFLGTPLILYRRHSSNASPTSEKSFTSPIDKIKWRYELLINLIVRYTKIICRWHKI